MQPLRLAEKQIAEKLKLEKKIWMIELNDGSRTAAKQHKQL